MTSLGGSFDPFELLSTAANSLARIIAKATTDRVYLCVKRPTDRAASLPPACHFICSQPPGFETRERFTDECLIHVSPSMNSCTAPSLLYTAASPRQITYSSAALFYLTFYISSPSYPTHVISFCASDQNLCHVWCIYKICSKWITFSLFSCFNKLNDDDDDSLQPNQLDFVNLNSPITVSEIKFSKYVRLLSWNSLKITHNRLWSITNMHIIN